jgi:ABC-type Fe3+-hydroxamate transport system substrate-binding protein
VKVVSSGSLESISKSYREVSENLGKEGNLKQILGTINSQIEKLSKLSHPNRSKRVVVQLGRNPLVVLGAGGYLNDLLTLVGVKNIFSHLNAKYPRVSYEEVLKRKPDSVWIVTMSPQDRGDDFWKIKTKIPTVAIAGNDIAQPTLRLLLEAEKWLGIHL